MGLGTLLITVMVAIQFVLGGAMWTLNRRQNKLPHEGALWEHLLVFLFIVESWLLVAALAITGMWEIVNWLNQFTVW